MRKLFTLGAAVAFLCAAAFVIPAGAADRKVDAVRDIQAAASTDLSARGYYRHRFWPRYFGPRLYVRPYYFPYAFYGPRFYGYYGGYRHYRRPGFMIGFGF